MATPEAEPLHERKTLLFKNSPVKGPPRKRFAARMILEEASDPKKLESFHELQKASAKFLYHHDYGPRIRDIPDTKTLGPKLSRQRTGPFKILERVGRLAYRLELPLHWRIHPVISIAHLEPAKEDPFDRPVPNHPDAVFSDEWEIERIVNKRIRRTKGGKHATEYLVRWTGYGPEYDQWYKEKDLSNAREAIKDVVPGHPSQKKIFFLHTLPLSSSILSFSIILKAHKPFYIILQCILRFAFLSVNIFLPLL
jgi:hypothetical protein